MRAGMTKGRRVTRQNVLLSRLLRVGSPTVSSHQPWPPVRRAPTPQQNFWPDGEVRHALPLRQTPLEGQGCLHSS